MRKLSNDEIKQTILEILIEFADFCDKNELRYYLAAGTLLGAVRHKGFIPWDDDIDVFMPRKDFERMHELLQKHQMAPYYKLIGLNAGNSFWPFAKIVDTRTKTTNEFASTDKWLWIDIFPIDGLPDDEEESAEHLRKAIPIKKNINRCHAKIGKGKNLFRAIAKIPMILTLKIISPKHFGKKLDKLARQYDFDKSNYVGCSVWSLGPKERMEKEKYLPRTKVEFCGHQFWAPQDYDGYLKSIYGDYMQLPPEEERVTHEFEAYIED